MVLVEWVWEWECHAKGQIVMAGDWRLRGMYDRGEMGAVLRLGLACSSSAPEGRPSMRQVVQVLDGDAPLPELGLGEVNASRRGYDEDHLRLYPTSGGGVVPLSPQSLLSYMAGR
ncbi:hypothetical protein AMTR_s00012p00255360 [Amborella trichopoda]|uniref:Serine-threonine/tyrosine-protein kinase catalytic domain-containing protein n=1 Tax=Amborella trichopoda TaxID=13333 RepID=W1PJT7_AMBTC|nr:hypothetical protein AMTR_s00012p00255360 [Amborella trichopoda]